MSKDKKKKIRQHEEGKIYLAKLARDAIERAREFDWKLASDALGARVALSDE